MGYEPGGQRGHTPPPGEPTNILSQMLHQNTPNRDSAHPVQLPSPRGEPPARG